MKTTGFFFIITRTDLLRMRNVPDNSCTENKNTYSVFNKFLFLKSCLLLYNVENFCRDGQATYNNMADAHCVLDNWDYTHIHQMLILNCFSTATMVSRMLCYMYIACLLISVLVMAKCEDWLLIFVHSAKDMLLISCLLYQNWVDDFSAKTNSLQ
jgi:hypothetical protein